MAMHARMVIAECLSDAQVAEFVRLYNEYAMESFAQDHAGFESAELIVEEGGNMVVATTHWQDRESCLKYHSSRSYRQLVAKTQHLLVGQFVVKIFATVSRLLPHFTITVPVAGATVHLNRMDFDPRKNLWSLKDLEEMAAKKEARNTAGHVKA